MSQKQLTKSSSNRMLTGTIAGICEYFGWSPDIITFVRILYVLLAFGSWGTFILVYFVASWIIPSAGSNTRGQDYRQGREENWSSYTERWQSKSSSGRKMKEAEPVEDDKKDDWSDF
ncbi:MULTISPECIES: PspC domain-containing protein [Lactococcus]|uniref:PspC domain-containing protein n=1 Tax=Lactococcus TaxID=1357 RepID=UPI000EDBF01A|nr:MULTISPECIES: PspC domain-containing protein [Lactococcus]HAP14733.1 hypothetical protein [Lactococcus sp.]